MTPADDGKDCGTTLAPIGRVDTQNLRHSGHSARGNHAAGLIEYEPPPQDWSEFAHWLAAAVLVAVIAAAVCGWVR
jgi:heme A synthase